jgi:ribosomal protein S27AE
MARPATSDAQTEAVLKRLDALAERAPDLAEPIAFYRAVLPALRAAQATVEAFTLTPEAAQRKLESGLPLLVGEDLPLDAETTRDLFLHLCRMTESLNASSNGNGKSTRKRNRSGWPFFARGRPDSLALMEQAPAGNGDGAALRAAAAQIRRAVEENELDLPAVWAALAMGDWGRLELAATGLRLDSELLRLLAHNSLKPALRVWAQGLKGVVDLDHWRRGQCPLCGSPPLLAEIQGKEGERRLRCGACGADWNYPRLKCAFCANQDYKSLGYISREGEEEKYRLQTCDQCRGYLKLVVTFDPTPVDLLPVEDLATLHLDLIANEREYLRMPVR